MASEHRLMEQLAAIEHERWADWQRYMHSKCTRNEDGTLTIPAWAVEQWERQIATPYADLSEQEKESDREQVRRYLHLFTAAAGEDEEETELVAFDRDGTRRVAGEVEER